MFEGFLIYVLYCIVMAGALALGVSLIFKIVDKLTPMLPFEVVAERYPWLLILLMGLILFCLTLLLRAINITIVPAP